MTAETSKRPWLAALLAFVYPGLGHVYLRSWFRALIWFGLAVLTAAAFIPETLLTGVDSLDGAIAVSRELPTDALLALLGVTALNVIDAYLIARGTRESEDEGTACPHCGRELDEDLAFCHWCTNQVREVPDEEAQW